MNIGEVIIFTLDHVDRITYFDYIDPNWTNDEVAYEEDNEEE